MFEALVDGQYANPVIVVDEIDKASADAQYDPLGAMYSLLEHDTAGAFMDEFAEVAIDASQVIWIMTANDERGIPEPILNRMNVFEIEPPSPEAARRIARNLYVSIRAEHGWGERFEAEPLDDVLDHLAELAPRDMRRALMTGFRQCPARCSAARSWWMTCPKPAQRRASWASCSKRLSSGRLAPCPQAWPGPAALSAGDRSLNSQFLAAANTAFGYGGLPRLPL